MFCHHKVTNDFLRNCYFSAYIFFRWEMLVIYFTYICDINLNPLKAMLRLACSLYLWLLVIVRIIVYWYFLIIITQVCSQKQKTMVIKLDMELYAKETRSLNFSPDSYSPRENERYAGFPQKQTILKKDGSKACSYHGA